MRIGINSKMRIIEWMNSASTHLKLNNLDFVKLSRAVRIFSDGVMVGERSLGSGVCRLAEKYRKFNHRKAL